ncbi:MAG: type II secretion system F family protein [Phycisphaerae bacterium]|nr:type II secretion system F family protein [Phycisphaerae bacterium]
MPTFSYVARDAAGHRVKGRLDAASESAALNDLATRGLAPVRVDAAQTARRRGSRVSVRQLARAYQQLADLLRAGVPLLKALQLLGRGKSNPRLSGVMASIADEIAQGERLADALSRHPRIFPSVQVAMVRAGERGGFLDQVLARLGAFLVHQADVRARVVGNLIYPVVLLCVGVGVVLAALVFFVPKFKDYYKKVELPLATKILLGLSDALVSWWPLLLILVAGAAVAGVWASRNVTVRRRAADGLVRLPVIGPLLRGVAAARFARTLGTLVENGIPMIGAMQISRDAAGHPALAEAVDRAIESVRSGETLARPLGASGFLEEDVVEMISVGESANNLAHVLLTVADSLETRTDRMLAVLIRLMEPALLLLLAGLVFFIFLALIVPMMRLSSAL